MPRCVQQPKGSDPSTHGQGMTEHAGASRRPCLRLARHATARQEDLEAKPVCYAMQQAKVNSLALPKSVPRLHEAGAVRR